MWKEQVIFTCERLPLLWLHNKWYLSQLKWMAGDFICVYTNNKYNIACTWPHDDTKFTVHFLQQIHKTPNPFFFSYLHKRHFPCWWDHKRWKVQLNVHNNQIASSYLELIINQLENQLITIKFNHCIFSDLAFGLENQGSIWWWRQYQWKIKL